MVKLLIEKLSFPENPAVYALMETIILILVILVTGFVINMINNMLTSLLAGVIGRMPAFIIRNYLTYPGTVFHELSHALFAFITGAKINKIVLFPKGATLGSVEIVPRGNFFTKALQLSISAAAPVTAGSLGLLTLYRYILPGISETWQYILFWYFFISILFHMCMSGADYANFFKGLLPTLAVVFLFFLVLGAFGVYY